MVEKLYAGSRHWDWEFNCCTLHDEETIPCYTCISTPEDSVVDFCTHAGCFEPGEFISWKVYNT